jgi:uncharacterized protein (DUF305 family)
MKRHARKKLPLAGLVATLIIAGWVGMDRSSAQDTPVNATVPPFTAANDVQFIDAIIPHHEHALEMANEELAKGTRAEVKAIAQRIKDTQAQEITTLRSARQALAQSGDVPLAPKDPHMEQDLALLKQATGAQVDAVFLEEMIPHHAEAISLAHRALPNLKQSEVRQIAINIVSTQAREIGEMQALRQ